MTRKAVTIKEPAVRSKLNRKTIRTAIKQVKANRTNGGPTKPGPKTVPVRKYKRSASVDYCQGPAAPRPKTVIVGTHRRSKPKPHPVFIKVPPKQ